MARYEHLPVYKTAMDLALYMETVVRGFTRYHKYTLGTDLGVAGFASPINIDEFKETLG